jgi:hypothetical protein
MKFKAQIAMDVRAYGYVEIEAESGEAAIASLTDQYVADNFDPNGCRDDYDLTTPVQIVVTSIEDEEGEVDDDIYTPISSQWDHKEIAMKRFIRGVEELFKNDLNWSVLDIDGAKEIYRELGIKPNDDAMEVEGQ